MWREPRAFLFHSGMMVHLRSNGPKSGPPEPPALSCQTVTTIRFRSLKLYSEWVEVDLIKVPGTSGNLRSYTYMRHQATTKETFFEQAQ